MLHTALSSFPHPSLPGDTITMEMSEPVAANRNSKQGLHGYIGTLLHGWQYSAGRDRACMQCAVAGRLIFALLGRQT